MEEIKPCVKCGAEDRYKSGGCRPCVNSAATMWRALNPEREKALKKRWYSENPEKEKARCAKYRAANKEKERSRCAKYRAANPEIMKTSSAKWKAANPESLLIHKHNRRAHKIANGGKLSTNLADTLYRRQKGKCVCCNEPLGKDYHLDHIMPLVLGGKNEDWNIQLLTPKCNLQKHAKHPVEYMQSRGLLI